MKVGLATLLLMTMASMSGARAGDVPRGTHWKTENRPVVAARLTCKAVSTCHEAVVLWCGGYSGADRDDDGIPCETVCSSREEVQAIEAEIGCNL